MKITLKGVQKSFGLTTGYGKTVLLELISGYESPHKGIIWLDECCVLSINKRIDIPPDLRGLFFHF